MWVLQQILRLGCKAMIAIPLRKKIPILVISTLVVPTTVLSVIFFLNQLLVRISDFRTEETTSFNVAKTDKKPPQALEKPKPKPKKKLVKQDIAPNLDSMLAGSSFGLDSFEWLGKDAFNDDLLDSSKQDTLTADKVDQAPILIKATPPQYPDHARKKGIAGHVTLNLLVTPAGKVESFQVIDSNPEGVFDQAAIQSVKAWTFQAAIDKGRNVAVWVEQKLSFSLN